jgi:hypothetical protein
VQPPAWPLAWRGWERVKRIVVNRIANRKVDARMDAELYAMLVMVWDARFSSPDELEQLLEEGY